MTHILTTLGIAHLVKLVDSRRDWADLVCRHTAYLEYAVQDFAVVHLKSATSACRRNMVSGVQAYLDRELADIQTGQD